MDTKPTGDKPLPTNQQLAEILQSTHLRRAASLPPHLEAIDFLNCSELNKLIQERLLAAPEPEKELSPKEQRELAVGLRKEIRGGTELNKRDFIQGFETYRFTKDFLRGAYTTHQQKPGGQTSCIVVSLDRFLPPDTQEPVAAVLAGIGAVFNVLTRHHTWPSYTAEAHHVFWLICKQVTVETALPMLTSGKNLMLVLGHPEHFPDYVPGINRHELLDFAKEMRSIDRDYPGWMLMSDPEENV